MRDSQSIQKAIEGVSNLPTLPVVIEKITRLLQNPQTSAEEVGKAITTDQAIAAKVLKLVNSAFYGFPGKIGTITHAIVILGFSTVKNIVLTASIFDFFQRRGNMHPDFDMEKFWIHSIACGAASQAIAKYVGYAEKEECFVGGLIHDVGKIVTCQILPTEFSEIVTTVKQKNLLYYQCEKDVLGLTHQEIGAILAQRWNLPRGLQNIVRYHHQPGLDKEFYQATSIVHCADVLVRALDWGWGGDSKIPLLDHNVWRDLGISDISLGGLLEDIDSEADKATAMMRLM